MEYQVISGDSHIDLRYMPKDLFITNAAARLKDKMPKVDDTTEDPQWVASDVGLGIAGNRLEITNYSTEMGTRWDAMVKGGFLDQSEKGFHPTTPELRIKDQDRDGVQAEVIYGLLGVSRKISDPEVVTEVYRIYNDWLVDFCMSYPGRFAGLACIPNHDPKEAATELRRAAKAGLQGADFGVTGTPKPIYHKDWDVLWQAADETGLSISFHTTGLLPSQVDPSEADVYARSYHNIRTVLFQLSGAEYLTSAIFSGACERFPNFKFVLGECGVSWLPYVIDRMDHEGTGQPGLTLKPSDYWHRQGYSTFQEEGIAGDLIHLIGDDNVIWGSDYPHPDGIWPDSLKIIENNLKNLKDPTVKEKIICTNAAKLYGFTK